MDKKSFIVSSLHEKEKISYWKDKSAVEKIEALEQIRRIIFGYDPTTSRLQRTFTIISLEDLRKNKKASGRHQDLADLENLNNLNK